MFGRAFQTCLMLVCAGTSHRTKHQPVTERRRSPPMVACPLLQLLLATCVWTFLIRSFLTTRLRVSKQPNLLRVTVILLMRFSTRTQRYRARR